MSNYEAVVANALANSAVWSGGRLNVTACSHTVVRDLVHLVIEDARRLLLEELIEESDDHSFEFSQSWLRSHMEPEE